MARAFFSALASKVSPVCVGGAGCYLGKVREALLYAQRRKFDFVEATEVYSGFMGVMN